MKVFYELRDKLCEQLEEMSKGRGRLDTQEVFFVTGGIKNIDKILMLQEGGYSGEGEWQADVRGSYNSGSSMASRGQHYVRGHYSRDSGGGYSNDGGYSNRGGYSRDGGYSGHGKEDIMQRMEQMANEADGKMRDNLYQLMDQMKKM